MNQLDNGTMEQEIIPDFENEMIEDAPEPQKKGCGCEKNKQKMQLDTKNNSLMWGGIVLLGLVLMYFVFRKKGGNSATVTE
tara:strand:- start:112 stop:354 length:243 start_codon:yes stop_codon:yes gene_type:complete